MQRTTRNQKHHGRNSDIDLTDDIMKIKAALRNATRDVRGKATQMLNDSYVDIKDRSHEVRDQLGDYIAEKPLKSVGIAVLTGIFIGFLLRK